MIIVPKPISIKLLDKTLDFSTVNLGINNLSENAKSDFLDFVRLPQGEENISFLNDDTMAEEEYKLSITDKVYITSSTPNGAFYGLQTLKQIVAQYGKTLPCCVIDDKPKYPYRGFMLDVGRYFYSVEQVKRYIDNMALHKLNFLHWHLTEDQGWRVEIKKYPLLTEIGSSRSHTNFNTKPHGGYYTQEDIKEVVEYAHSKYIKIMPEFDIPGHSVAAISAYNYLKCTPGDMPVATHWGVKHDVLCAGKDSTYQFVYDVLDELCELFQDGYFHIGGDEVPKHRWSFCPECQAKMKAEGLKDEDELQVYFMNKVNDYLKNKGYQCFMWSWDLKNGHQLDNSLGFTLCNTDNNDQDRPCIDTSASAYYIDLPYGYIPMDKSISHMPPDNKNCLGVEATLWTEYVPNMKKADIMTYPRLGAMCETGWYGTAKDFNDSMPFYLDYLTKNNISYSTGNRINPTGLRKFTQIALFERRQLVWEGLTNIIKDNKAKKTLTNMSK